MQVTSTTNTQAKQTELQPGSMRIPQKNLGQQDFLRLITVQLANQDPMKPMEDTAFIAQMAQFTALEQSNQLSKEFARLRVDAEMNSASNMIGRQVTLIDERDQEVVGTVLAVDRSTDVPRLLIGEKLYPYNSVTRVEDAPLEPVPPAA